LADNPCTDLIEQDAHLLARRRSFNWLIDLLENSRACRTTVFIQSGGTFSQSQPRRVKRWARGSLSSATGQAVFVSCDAPPKAAARPKGYVHFMWFAPAVTMAVKLTPPETLPDSNAPVSGGQFAMR
jgi:hypothetical protein